MNAPGTREQPMTEASNKDLDDGGWLWIMTECGHAARCEQGYTISISCASYGPRYAVWPKPKPRPPKHGNYNWQDYVQHAILYCDTKEEAKAAAFAHWKKNNESTG